MPEQTREQWYQRYQKVDASVMKVCDWIGRHQARAMWAAEHRYYKRAYREQQRVCRLQGWYVKLVMVRTEALNRWLALEV